MLDWSIPAPRHFGVASGMLHRFSPAFSLTTCFPSFYHLVPRIFCPDGLKKLPEEVARLRQAHPQATVELWSSDEHRIGLKPILRRVWGKKGSKVTAVV